VDAYQAERAAAATAFAKESAKLRAKSARRIVSASAQSPVGCKLMIAFRTLAKSPECIPDRSALLDTRCRDAQSKFLQIREHSSRRWCAELTICEHVAVTCAKHSSRG
jgi:hypothetical protein